MYLMFHFAIIELVQSLRLFSIRHCNSHTSFHVYIIVFVHFQCSESLEKNIMLRMKLCVKVLE